MTLVCTWNQNERSVAGRPGSPGKGRQRRQLLRSLEPALPARVGVNVHGAEAVVNVHGAEAVVNVHGAEAVGNVHGAEAVGNVHGEELEDTDLH